MTLQADPSRRGAVAGAAMICLGLVLFAAMMAFPERLNVPAPVGYLAACTFVLAGALAVANVFCGRAVRAWLAVALLSCMVVPSAWIAIGPGRRSCSVGFGFLSGSAGDGMCRVAFGIGSVFCIAFLLIALRYALNAGRK